MRAVVVVGAVGAVVVVGAVAAGEAAAVPWGSQQLLAMMITSTRTMMIVTIAQ